MPISKANIPRQTLDIICMVCGLGVSHDMQAYLGYMPRDKGVQLMNRVILVVKQHQPLHSAVVKEVISVVRR